MHKKLFDFKYEKIDYLSKLNLKIIQLTFNKNAYLKILSYFSVHKKKRKIMKFNKIVDLFYLLS